MASKEIPWRYLLSGVIVSTASPKPLARSAYFDCLSDVLSLRGTAKIKYGLACGCAAGLSSSWLYRLSILVAGERKASDLLHH